LSERFGPTVRLLSHAEFVAVQENGRRVATRYVTLLGRANTLSRDRLGIIASKRLGNAVVRNRAKRRLRDVFRRGHPDYAGRQGRPTFDFVAIPRRELIAAPMTAVDTDFRAAVRKLRGVE
jgi:ribonuclease P protein component